MRLFSKNSVSINLKMNFSLSNFSNLVHFFRTHFPTLHLVQFSATQFQLWDKQYIIWARIEVEKNKLKIISIQEKSIIINDFDAIEGLEIRLLQDLNYLSVEFYQTTKSLLEKAKLDFVQRKKKIENQFRTGFSTKQKEDLQPIIQLLEEGGHSLYLLPEWITIFEFWKVIYQNSKFKKTFFQRNEIIKSLHHFYNTSHKIEIPTSYSKLENWITNFSNKNKIQENELLLYGILNEFLDGNDNLKINFIPLIQQKINQIENKSKKIWINDNLILKSLELNNEKFKKKTLFGTFENFDDLLLAFSTQNETSQFAFESKKSISQVGIFGLSKNSELLDKINNKLNSESNYDLIILDSEKQNRISTKEISIFQSLSKKDKQLLGSFQNSFKSLSENGVLIALFTQNHSNLVEKKSLSSLRSLLQEWFERIEIYENKNKNESSLAITFYKKTELENGVFYSELKQGKPITFHNNFLPHTWKLKPVLSEYQKLIPSINQNSKKGSKNAIFKTYFRAIPTQKIENFIELNSTTPNENNLKSKVKEFIQNHNQQITQSEEKIKTKLESKLEKKKTVLASKLAKDTLFESDILEKIEAKTQREIEEKTNKIESKKQLEFKEKNLIETQISVFESGLWYYEKDIFERFESPYNYDLDTIFPSRKQGENILLFWTNTENGGEIWATDKPVPSTFLNNVLPNSYIFPFYVYENGKRKSNFSNFMLQKFKRGYAAAFEKRVERVEQAIQTLFDLSDFEFLQVHQELAFELRALSNIIDRDEYKMTKELKENLHNPEQNTYIQFEQIIKVFKTTKRTFERLENKAARNKESFETLKNYFKEGEKAINFIEDYWQKLEVEEASNFVVPTEENMTNQLILGYIFAVWQRDIFKSKYKEELKNEIPRIPIYKDFHHFANKGEFLLQKYLKETNAKLEFEIVELFEEQKPKTKSKSSKKSSKIWFEKEGTIYYDKTTFLQPISIELDFDKINQFQINEKSFFELTLAYLRKNKIKLNEGKIF